MRDEDNQSSSKSISRNKNIPLTSIAILAFFLITYSFFYSGTFVTDDEHILTSRSISLAFDDNLNLSRVIGNSRVYDYSIVAPLQAQQVANIEPLQTILGALLTQLSVLINVGRIQTLFLLNIWTTSLTAMVIYLTARKHNYSNSVGIILSMLFGLCTIAFPYSRTFFRDSLAMLFIALLWYCAISIRNSRNSFTALISWVGLFASGILGALSKNTTVIAIPVVLMEILVLKKNNNKLFPKNNRKKTFISWIIGIGIVFTIIVFWLFIIPTIPVFARFTPIYYFSLFSFFVSTPHPNMIQAIIGPFISSGKSIFLFSPILILSIYCLFYRFKSSLAAWSYLLLLIVAQALFYDAEWAGHVNWGLRFILPAIPPLVLSIAPVIEKMIRSIIGIAGLLFLALISFSIQIVGSVSPIGLYFSEKASAAIPVTEHSLIWDFNQSPILWCINWIFKGQLPNLAVARVKEGLDFMLICLILTSFLFFISILNHRFRKISIIALSIAIIANFSMLFIYRTDSAYYPTRMDLKDSQKQIETHFQKNDVVLLKSYGTSSWEYWMNWTGPKIKWVALPYSIPSPSTQEQFLQTHDPTIALDRITLSLLKQFADSGRHIWLVLPSNSPGFDLGIEEAWLQERSNNFDCQIFKGESESTTICNYEIK